MRILFALPGLHRYERGAEVALRSLAVELARGGDAVTLIGSGPPVEGEPYRFVSAPSIRRERLERLPKVGPFRSETVYEEATFAFSLARRFEPLEYDVTVTCSYPFTNWILRRSSGAAARPRHVFVTQNGDWPAYSDKAEFRLFSCDGLVCTNPDYFERNHERWRSALIPNGLDVARFAAGKPDRARLQLPEDCPLVLMVSALIESKRVADGIRAVAKMPKAHLAVAGDGPLRDEVTALAKELLPGRFTRLTVGSSDMPSLYRSADAFLHLSKDESFGNVYIEALASGVPIVAHETARTRWILGEHASLIDTDISDAVTRALNDAINSPPPASAELEAWIATFSWTEVAAKYRSFFDSL